MYYITVSVDQESRLYFVRFSISESHLKAAVEVLARASVSLQVLTRERSSSRAT